MHRIFTTSVAAVYPHYVTKVERKGRTKAELDQVIGWLTGYDESTLRQHLAADTTFDAFFAEAQLNPKASSITGVVCGVRVTTAHESRCARVGGNTAGPSAVPCHAHPVQERLDT
jgi:hypothetical protein